MHNDQLRQKTKQHRLAMLFCCILLTYIFQKEKSHLASSGVTFLFVFCFEHNERTTRVVHEPPLQKTMSRRGIFTNCPRRLVASVICVNLFHICVDLCLSQIKFNQLFYSHFKFPHSFLRF